MPLADRWETWPTDLRATAFLSYPGWPWRTMPESEMAKSCTDRKVAGQWAKTHNIHETSGVHIAHTETSRWWGLVVAGLKSWNETSPALLHPILASRKFGERFRMVAPASLRSHRPGIENFAGYTASWMTENKAATWNRSSGPTVVANESWNQHDRMTTREVTRLMSWARHTNIACSLGAVSSGNC
jgi:hypothetical protein